MMMSSSQIGKILKKNNMLPNKDPPEGRTTAIVAIGTLLEGYVRNVPLPRVPLQQSTSTLVRHTIPDYYEFPYGVPMHTFPCSIVESAAYAFSPTWHTIAINT
jgi:hypothetical protein